jgi:hypothetical protein
VQPGCVLFVPDAQALPEGEFRQLLRIAAGIRNNGLRLVVLFNESRQGDCDGRIAALGHEVARWDLDDDPQAAEPSMAPHTVRQGGRVGPLWQRFTAQGRASASGSAAFSSLRRARHASRWLAAAAIAASLATLPAMLPPSLSDALSAALPGMLTHPGSDANDPESAHVLTRSGSVALAGEPHQDYVRAQPASTQEDALSPASLPKEDLPTTEGRSVIDASGTTRHDGREADLR